MITTPADAQERMGSSTTVGLAATQRNSPHDADYNDSGGSGEVDKFELFIDFGAIRLGINTMHGLDEDTNPERRLRSNTFFLAYRARANEDRSKLDAYLMGGVAIISSAIYEGETKVIPSDNYGYLLGAGASYYFLEKLGLGIQIIRISGEGDFAGDTIQTGSNQLQMVFLYPF